MITEEKAKKDFEWPEKLHVLLRAADTRAPHLREVFYVKQAKAYIDTERHVYETHLEQNGGGVHIRLVADLKGDVEMDVNPRGDIGWNFANMLTGSPQDSQRPVFLYEWVTSSRKTRTVFRTVLEAHREWYRVMKQERTLADGVLAQLEEWFTQHDIVPVVEEEKETEEPAKETSKRQYRVPWDDC